MFTALGIDVENALTLTVLNRFILFLFVRGIFLKTRVIKDLGQIFEDLFVLGVNELRVPRPVCPVALANCCVIMPQGIELCNPFFRVISELGSNFSDSCVF